MEMTLDRVWIKRLFFILYITKLLVVIPVNVSSQELVKNGDFQYGKYMYSLVLKTVKHVGPKMCILACARQLGCNSVNFLPNELYCELLVVSPGSVLVDKDGCNYSPLSAWEISNGVCWPNPCREFQTCVVTTKNRPVCVNSGVHVIKTNHTDCKDIKEKMGNAYDGIYLTSTGVYYCDMTTDGGGWTVFQRRMDGSVDFFRYWIDYKYGFGNLNGEFWLGNDKLHEITSAETCQMRVDLEDGDGNIAFVLYQKFSIANEQSSYRLSIGGYSGTTANTMGNANNNGLFQTRDRDGVKKCATKFVGAWWHITCVYINLNGEYLPVGTGGTYDGSGIYWYHFNGYRNSLKSTKMMIRRI